MAVPNFLSSNFRYLSTAAVTDVNTIIADLMAELVTGPAAADKWTDVGGAGTGPFKSPVNSIDGSYITMVCTRISATRISYTTTDSFATLMQNVDTRQDIDAGGTEIRYFTGPNHCCVDSVRATPEAFHVARLDVWPETSGKIKTSWHASQGPRNASGTLTATAWTNSFCMAIGGTAYSANPTFSVPRFNTNASTTTRFVTPSGAYVFTPWEIADNTTNIVMGRLPQAVLIDSVALNHGNEVTLTLDTGVTGIFKVTGHVAANQRRVAWRKA
jgi:hypothetical protein